jgi:hypothetical protein
LKLRGEILNIGKIVENCERALKEGRAVATTLKIFVGIFDRERILLQRDSGKWQLIGGVIELKNLGNNYQDAFKNALARIIKEETGCEIDLERVDIVLLPIVTCKDSINLAFGIPIDVWALKGAQKFLQDFGNKSLSWSHLQNLETLSFVSLEMEYLVSTLVHYYQSTKPQNRAKLLL